MMASKMFVMGLFAVLVTLCSQVGAETSDSVLRFVAVTAYDQSSHTDLATDIVV